MLGPSDVVNPLHVHPQALARLELSYSETLSAIAPPRPTSVPADLITESRPESNKAGGRNSGSASEVAPMELEADGVDTILAQESQPPPPPDPTAGRWFRPSNIVIMVVLFLMFILMLFYFMMQATPLMDVLTDIKNARRWIGVTPAVEAVVFILCIPAILVTLFVTASVSCCWRRSLRRAREAEDSGWSKVMKTRWAIIAVWMCLEFLGTPSSPYFFIIQVAFEAAELLVQALSVEQMSRAGFGKELLCLYTGLILVNALGPIGYAWISRRALSEEKSRSECTEASLRRRAATGRWIARLLMLDACVDMGYALFPVLSLLVRFGYLFLVGDVETDRRLNNYGLTFRHPVNVLKSYLLMAEAEAVFFGGESATDSFVKILSRCLPLFVAPFRLQLAFEVHRLWKNSVSNRALVFLSNHERQAAKEDKDAEPHAINVPPSREKVRDIWWDRFSRPQITARKVQRKGCNVFHKASSQVRHVARHTIRRAHSRQARLRFFVVPWWPAISLSLASAGFSLFVLLRLATWGTCPIDRVREACERRAYPIFTAGSSTEGSPDLASCACNTIFFISNCTTAAQQHQNSSDSELLNHPPILRSTTTAFISACSGDTNMLSAIAHGEQFSVLHLHISLAIDGFGSTATTTATPEGNSTVVPWRFDPEKFGCKFSPTTKCNSDSSRSWPLQVFLLSGHNAIRAENLGPVLANTLRRGRMKELWLREVNLQSIPPEVGQLPNLIHLSFENNGGQLTSVPASLGKLTSIEHLDLNGNGIQAVPDSLGDLPLLYHLNLADNRITVLPESLGRLAGLRRLHLENNALRSLPAPLMLPSFAEHHAFSIGVQGNAISAAALQTALAPAKRPTAAGQPASKLLIVALNPACNYTTGSTSRQVPVRVGSWRIKCEPECAATCEETAIGDMSSAVGNGFCDDECDVASCGNDGGDCTWE